MKKILALLAVTTLSTPCASFASGFKESNNVKISETVKSSSSFSIWNLGTWGPTQKTIINKVYIASATAWYDQRTPAKATWANWIIPADPSSPISPSPQIIAFANAFSQINPNITITPFFWVFKWSFSPLPGMCDNLKNVLAKGMQLNVKTVHNIPDPFKGQLVMENKGVI